LHHDDGSADESSLQATASEATTFKGEPIMKDTNGATGRAHVLPDCSTVRSELLACL